MEIPEVPREQVMALLRYRHPDPTVDALLEYGAYHGKSLHEVQEEYRQLEKIHFGVVGSEIQLLPLLLSHLQLDHLIGRLQTMLGVAITYQGKSFLDIGAGTGRDCIAFARCGFQTTHADIPWEGLDFARWRYQQRHLDVRCVDVRELPEERFTCIGCHDVFEHVDDPVDLLVRFATHLEPGGLFFGSFDLFNPLPTHRPANDLYVKIFDPLLKHLGLDMVLGTVNPVMDATRAGMRIYQRSRPVIGSVAEEYTQNSADAAEFAIDALLELRETLEGELAYLRGRERQLTSAVA